MGARVYTDAELAALLPWPAEDANKYTRGKAVLVAGCARYPGAACLAARASQRAGAGYTQVLCAPESVAAVRQAGPSLVVEPWESLIELGRLDCACGALGGADCYPVTVNDARARAACTALFPPAAARRPRAYLVGSGFDARDEESFDLARTVLANAQAPVVVDGGGLAALAQPALREVLRRRFVDGHATVLTPHAGEAARLAGPFDLSIDDPVAAARALSCAYGAVVVLKGPVTYVSDGERVARVAESTPALAKAGTGDVLAGVVVALAAQRLDVFDASILGVELHARAGLAAAERLTALCVTAEDVVECLPQAVKALTAR